MFLADMSFIIAKTSDTAKRKTAITTNKTPTTTKNIDFLSHTGMSSVALIRHRPERKYELITLIYWLHIFVISFTISCKCR